MFRIEPSVTWSEKDAARLPDWASGTCALIDLLRRRNVLSTLGERLRISRQGGFAGFDIFLFLLYFFGSGQSGLRPFWRYASPHALQLGALAGRRGLPSPASISRALDRVQFPLIRPLTTWLLAEATSADELLRHPTVLARDARGQGWHVFHFDPTVTTLYQRSLPEDDDLPEPRRRGEQTAAPGHQGRKRGDICFRRATLQHAGASLWLHATLAPGNGDRRADLNAAVDAAVTTCTRIGHPLGRALFVMDGEFANVPAYTALRERKLPFITRFTRYGILDKPEVRKRLAEAIWLEVPDDRSGPRRSAIDLGIIKVRAADETRREDGTRYAPVSVRVVVSRYLRSSEPEHGRVIEGWQYELFAVDADPEEWPAPDSVQVFFSRGGQENRFGQEDRELGLDRIFSYHLPGQELACLVGLMLWNLQVVNGFQMDRPPAELDASPPRRSTVDARSSGLSPYVPETEPEPEPEPEPDTPPTKVEVRRAQLLSHIEWTAWEAKNPGWRWSPEAGHIECPEQQQLRLVGVTLQPNRQDVRPQLFFRGRRGACKGCPLRADCTRVQTEPFTKKLGISVDLVHAKKLKGTFKGTSKGRRGHQSLQPQRVNNVLSIALAPLEPVSGPHDIVDAGFTPAGARDLVRAATRDLSVRVIVTLPPPATRRPTLVSLSRAHRQHRRKTWTENLARYALPEGTDLRVDYSGGAAARSLLGVTDAAA